MTKRKWLLLVLILSGASYLAFYCYKSQFRPNLLLNETIQSESWKSAAMSFQKKHKKGKILFVGNSLTSGLPVFLPNEEALLVYGIPGDFTAGVIKRIPELIEARPIKIFIEIGINDILAGFKKRAILSNYKTIIHDLTSGLPDCKIFIQSIFPTNFNSGFFANSDAANTIILDVNNSLLKLCEETGVTFIDIHTPFLKEGVLRDDYTSDGVHLTPKGYQEWVQILQKYL